ncbi:cytochrome c biogenesis protein ResB [Roseateles paludis]|uniref:Cytochrome c biogenesis protein ResB n=1 Tax=Roseateles paludis TaxID=3145238 RepID=A0ABV0G676_9BURK
MTDAALPTAPPSRSAARELYELLASMRFAISLLTVICIASMVGTVVKQHEPMGNYVNQFGPFWAELFGRLGLYTVYSAPWFLLILAFLVLSTSLCIARNTPKILADLRSFKENVREQSLTAHHHKAIGDVHSAPSLALTEFSKLLQLRGWKFRVQRRDNGIMIAARKGAANKIGYLAAHSAIVLVCVGGLLDGDLMVRLVMWAQGKQPYSGSGLVSDVRPEHRLASSTPGFRANVFVPEGQRAATGLITLPSGVVLQDLPFEIELKQFKVEYYSTGMPKSFASDIVLRDLDGHGAERKATVRVNEPVIHRGIAIYQSSFDDGGSKLKLHAVPMDAGQAFELEGRVGDKQLVAALGDQQLEIAGLRVINVENMGANEAAAELKLGDHLGSGAKVRTNKDLRNVGPSFSYRLRDAAGQAREYNNYMLPVELDGQRVFLAGMRESAAEGFRYLRMPVDEKDSLDGFLNLRRALLDPAVRQRAAERYAAQGTPAGRTDMQPQLLATTQQVLGLFAGAVADAAAPSAKDRPRGLPALSDFVERKVPEAERAKMSEVLLRILNGSLFELHKLARETAGLPPPATDAATQAFMTQSVLALSDSLYYPAPYLLQLSSFEQVQASVFQVARAPGQKLVYLGAVLLIIGVFAMLYIRERRLWIWITPSPNEAGGSLVRLALSTTRDTPDNALVFDELRRAVLHEDERAH